VTETQFERYEKKEERERERERAKEREQRKREKTRIGGWSLRAGELI